MKIKKIQDTFFAAFVAGSIATVVQMAISWLLFLFRITEQNPSLFHARLLTNKINPNFGEMALGIFDNFVSGIFFALIIVYALRLTGTDFALLKGAFIGYINAMIHFLLFARLFVNPSQVLPNAVTLWQVFVAYTIWGIIVAYIIERYSDIKINKL